MNTRTVPDKALKHTSKHAGKSGRKSTSDLSRYKILLIPVLLLIALVSIPLPFPTGLPLLALSLSLLLTHSRGAKVRYIRFKRSLNPDGKVFYWVSKIDQFLRTKNHRQLLRSWFMPQSVTANTDHDHG